MTNNETNGNVSQEIEITLIIPKGYYDIAMEINALLERNEDITYYGTPEQAKHYHDVHTKVEAIYKREKITTVRGRKAVQRARDIIHLKGAQ